MMRALLAAIFDLAPQAAFDAAQHLRFVTRLDQADHSLFGSGSGAEIKIGRCCADGLRVRRASQRQCQNSCGNKNAFHDVPLCDRTSEMNVQPSNGDVGTWFVFDEARRHQSAVTLP